MPTSISGTAGVTYPAGGLANTAGAGVGTTDTQTLTNKTLTTPTIATIKSAASATPTVFQDSAGTEIGTLCRAWVNYKGTATRAINASFNVSSVTFNSTGSYTVNFTTAMTDANYCAQVTAGDASSTALNITDAIASTYTTTTLLVQTFTAQAAANTGRAFIDETFVNVSVFR